MSPEGAGSPPGDDEPETVSDRRRDQVFGEVLPESTADDRASAWGDAGAADPDGRDGGDEWLRREVPPHHG